MFYQHLKAPLEALLFAHGKPVAVSVLAEVLQVEEEHILLLLAEMQEEYGRSERGIMLYEVAGGFQLGTKEEWASLITALAGARESKLSAPALETLAIIAFKQPVTKQEMEEIRGVRIDKVLTQLVERGLIREVGRKESLGRPILYGTTEDFLECFGLRDLQQLPDLQNLLPNEAANTEEKNEG